MWRLVGIICAVVLHVGFILFGGLLVGSDKEGKGTLQEVELLGANDAAAEKEKAKEPEKKPEMEAAETEQAPDAAEIIRQLEQATTSAAPALDAASLSAIGEALLGQGGRGTEFAEALSLASGGRIGGTGKAGALNEKLEGAFSLGEIDQKPRPVFQGPPLYPSEMRGKRVEGVVTVVFLVDCSGKVADPRVEKSTNLAFDRPALEAVKQWRFEPAVKAGQRVACKMRVPIRFQPS